MHGRDSADRRLRIPGPLEQAGGAGLRVRAARPHDRASPEAPWLRIHELLELIRETPALGEPLEGAPAYLRVEIHHAASHEGALHLDDVLTRRTRISIETFDRGVVAARPTADLMGSILGWDEETKAREIEHYDARVRAERESQTQPDDRTADAARLGAPDVRLGPQIPQPPPVASLEAHRRAE